MRILAIRGENLASLAEPFAIEFESEPLRSTGLFAITGETGAGKSTILDALCLALYDKFPRVVASGGAEGAPDPSGETLASGDPRAILRRGAGRGFAEADFVARDGLRYRARCDLMRARGRVAGKLQNRGRSLWRIDEHGEKIETLESGVEPVNRRIIELTDLTFDQFRRTALLAQGDFDAFLRADAKERADLLEKITGAEIYGVLSKRAYERADAARKAVAALEERSEGLGVMAQEERAATLAEAEQATQHRAALASERESAMAMLRRIDARAQAQAKLAQAQAAREAAAAALQSLAPQRQLLADLARAEPLRAPREDVQRTEKALAEKRAEGAQAFTRAQAAIVAQQEAQAQERQAGEALIALDAEIAGLAPIWAQAGALDQQMTALAQEEADARRLCDEATKFAVAKRDERAVVIAQQDATQRARRDAAEIYDALAPARPLSERWSEIDDWLEKRAELTEAKTVAQRDLASAQVEATRAAQMSAACAAADAADREKGVALLAQLETRGAALAALDAPAAERRAEERARAHELLQAMDRCAREYAGAQTRCAGAESEIARFAAEGEALAERLAALRLRRDAQLLENDAAARLGELADAAANETVENLRARLEEAAPCPVCGSLDHPFSHSDDAAQRLVAELRARREEARRALKGTNDEIAATVESQSKARALAEDAGRRRDDAQQASTQAAQEYVALRAKYADAPDEIATAGAALESLMQRVASEREAAGAKIAAARLLRDEIDQLRKTRDDIDAAIESRRREREEADAMLRRAGEARVRLAEKIAGDEQRIESLDRSLAPFLKLCDLAVADLDRDGAGARMRLQTAGARFAEAARSLAALEETLAALALRAAKLDAEVDASASRAREAQAAHETRARALAAVRTQRAGLLDGEATAAHRLRFDEKRRALHEAHEQARAKLAGAGAERAACEARSAACASAHQGAETACASAQATFAQALAATGLDAASAESLLAFSPQEATGLRGALEAAQTQLSVTHAAVDARRADAEEAGEAAPDEPAREALAARAAQLAGEIDALSARLGAMQERIARDDEARSRAAALAQEIEAARAARKTWDEVNLAIGSKEGDKFRRFAQSVTLQQLVALANRRLALLSSRYALERAGEIGSLGLQIVDRDLGDERRSTRSLSGGERFLASLALALALAGLEGRDSFVDTLFIDEGFGALDAATLDVAIDALENLQGQGRKVGVISHVESMQQRIATKVSVERRGGGVSVVRLRAAGFG